MRIVSRREWDAQCADGAGPAPLPADYLYLHHTATSPNTTIRTIEKIGQGRFGRGISYTFCVAFDGTVYEGHSIDRKGTHTKGLNSRARSICLIGDYTTVAPSEAQIDSVVELIRHGHQQGWWPDHLTGGHRDAPDAATACPGNRAHALIPTINWRVGAPTPTPPAAPTEEMAAWFLVIS